MDLSQINTWILDNISYIILIFGIINLYFLYVAYQLIKTKREILALKKASYKFQNTIISMKRSIDDMNIVVESMESVNKLLEEKFNDTIEQITKQFENLKENDIKKYMLSIDNLENNVANLDKELTTATTLIKQLEIDIDSKIDQKLSDQYKDIKICKDEILSKLTLVEQKFVALLSEKHTEINKDINTEILNILNKFNDINEKMILITNSQTDRLMIKNIKALQEHITQLKQLINKKQTP